MGLIGWLIRVLLILIVLYYILSKFEKMFGRMFGSSNANNNRHKGSREETDLHIDYRTGNKKGGKHHHDYDGGEYVDYEEVDK